MHADFKLIITYGYVWSYLIKKKSTLTFKENIFANKSVGVCLLLKLFFMFLTYKLGTNYLIVES